MPSAGDVQWLRANLRMSYGGDIENLANTVETTVGLIVPAVQGFAHTGVRRQGCDRWADALLPSGAYARAVLEATAYQTREVLDHDAASGGT